MTNNTHRETVEQVIEQAQYLALGTAVDDAPWVAPIEFFRDAAGNFCFFSTVDSRHARHIDVNETVSIALWLDEQPEYSPALSATLNGVQLRGRAYRVTEDEYSPTIEAAVEQLDAPMPPYAAFVVEPQRLYAPVVDDGVNRRVEVELG